jgi:hypothetical protein
MWCLRTRPACCPPSSRSGDGYLSGRGSAGAPARVSEVA